MRRYSIAPSSSRRKSTINPNEDTAAAREELEKLEQETTLVMQEIDKNISRANAVINDRLIPTIKEYSMESKKVWDNAGFWKFFFEQSANVELNSYEDPINTNTDANTLANSRNNLLFDEDVETEQEQEVADENADFKKPLLKTLVEESTPTWSTEQTKKQLQSSTPQLHKRPSMLPTYNKQVYDSNDSIGIHQPPILSTTLSSTDNRSPTRSQDSPVKVQTVRQSLDTYHRISISPRKSKTNARHILSEEARRRSSMIQDLINSSPTLPEPPILMSELANMSEPSSPIKNLLDTHREPNLERFSPVLLPPELSPIKHILTDPPTSKSNENTFQRFPSTPKFNDRVSDGAKTDIMRTPLGIRIRYGGDDSDLQPPELQNDLDKPRSSRSSEQNQFNAEEDEVASPPELQTIDFSIKKRLSQGDESMSKKGKPLESNDDNQNVFLDTKNVSAGSTLYHSMLQENQTNKSKDSTENHSLSQSVSQIFDNILLNTSKDTVQATAQRNITEARDIFSDMSGSQNDISQQEHTENSTSELGSLLRERFHNLTKK
jgi:DASH complex subunit ASK1